MFEEIELRERAASGVRWEPGTGAWVEVIEGDGRGWRLRVTREREPAGPAGVEFIGHARAGVAALLAHVRRARRSSAGELDRLARRAAGAGPASDRDDEADVNLWRGTEPAADRDFEFVAAARQDIPRLLEAARA